MLRVGLTGGIGSGKTTVCKLFERLGVPVYYADVEARKLYSENTELKKALQIAFGDTVYEGKEINKSKLRGLLLDSAESAEKLNAIVHPYVFEHYENWCRLKAQHPYTIKEAAILFESGSYKRVHKVVGVVAPLETRIMRVMNRDGLSRSDVQARINRQWPEEKWLSQCDFVINNAGAASLEPQVDAIHKALINTAETKPNCVFKA